MQLHKYWIYKLFVFFIFQSRHHSVRRVWLCECGIFPFIPFRKQFNFKLKWLILKSDNQNSLQLPTHQFAWNIIEKCWRFHSHGKICCISCRFFPLWFIVYNFCQISVEKSVKYTKNNKIHMHQLTNVISVLINTKSEKKNI